MNDRPGIRPSQNLGPRQSPRRLPRDSRLLPLSHGELLVSRSHAVFCRIPPGQLEALRAVLASRHPLDLLSREFLAELERHAFFLAPRPLKPDRPTVQLQLTNACHLACAYCCTNSGEARPRELCYEHFLRIVREIPQAVGPETQVALLGGEPLRVPWALDLAADILDLGLDLTLFTNGVPLADEGLAERVVRLLRRGARIRVSLAGASAESCDAVSGAPRFEAALQGLHALAARGGRATVDLMLIPQRAEPLVRELPRLRKRLPPDTRITLGVLYRSGRETGEHLFRSRTDLEAALDQIAFGAGETIPASEIRPTTYRREGCVCASGRHVHVRSDGALFGCFKMEEKVGDLKQGGFADTARWLREHPQRSVALPRCADCPLATLCGAGCRSENQLYTGNPEEAPCGPWRVRVLSELLAEDRPAAVEWPVAFLLHEARTRGLETPEDLVPQGPSLHLVEV